MSEEAIFEQYKPLLFSIAYNMLGSVMDAEDCVQEAFLRWHKASLQGENEAVRSPKAYLCTIVTNLCIDQMRSARYRHEEYMGVWLPEPIVAMNDSVEMAETLSLAFLRLLEKLSPIERAAFLLRQVFDYEYEEIASIVGKSEENCRQIVHRARRHLASRRPSHPVAQEQEREITSQFMQAVVDGDMDGLLKLLADDIVLYSDGGGKVHAALNPIFGKDKALRVTINLLRKYRDGLIWRPCQVNGHPGLVFYRYGKLLMVLTIEIRDALIYEIDAVLNPDKLQHFALLP